MCRMIISPDSNYENKKKILVQNANEIQDHKIYIGHVRCGKWLAVMWMVKEHDMSFHVLSCPFLSSEREYEGGRTARFYGNSYRKIRSILSKIRSNLA